MIITLRGPGVVPISPRASLHLSSLESAGLMAPSGFGNGIDPDFDWLVSVLIVGLSYGARNVLSYTKHMLQNCLAFRDSPIIPLRRSPREKEGVTFWCCHFSATDGSRRSNSIRPTRRPCVGANLIKRYRLRTSKLRDPAQHREMDVVTLWTREGRRRR